MWMRKHWKIWKPALSEEEYTPVTKILEPYRLSFLGYGGTCLSFVDDKLLVYKICLKEDNEILQSAHAFLEHCRKLREVGIPILPPIEILFDNDLFLVYTQEFCNPLPYVNAKIVSETLTILKAMLLGRYKLTDIYYRNLGLWKNQVLVYDYHDYKEFARTDHTYICHLAHLFNLHRHSRVYQSINIGIEDLVADDFGADHFEDQRISGLLSQLYQLPSENYSEEACQRIVPLIDELVEAYRDLNVVRHSNYQFLHIDREGLLHLEGHTLLKFQLAEEILSELPKGFTAIDCGCSLGGIGNLIAQRRPDSQITLNNLTVSELDTAQEVSQHLCLNNVSFDNTNILTFRERSFDLTMFYALLHHLLKDIPFHELIRFIHSMTHLYTVVDIPLKGDVLLDNIIANGNLAYHDSFVMLESIETFQEAIKDYYQVVVSRKIDYDSSQLNRWGFVLRKV